jgi:hypothetical protein
MADAANAVRPPVCYTWGTGREEREMAYDWQAELEAAKAEAARVRTLERTEENYWLGISAADRIFKAQRILRTGIWKGK